MTQEKVARAQSDAEQARALSAVLTAPCPLKQAKARQLLAALAYHVEALVAALRAAGGVS